MTDPRRSRKALGRFAAGVTVVTAAREGEVDAMTANALTSVAPDPPLVLASIDHSTLGEVRSSEERPGEPLLFHGGVSGRMSPDLELVESWGS